MLFRMSDLLWFENNTKCICSVRFIWPQQSKKNVDLSASDNMPYRQSIIPAVDFLAANSCCRRCRDVGCRQSLSLLHYRWSVAPKPVSCPWSKAKIGVVWWSRIVVLSCLQSLVSIIVSMRKRRRWCKYAYIEMLLLLRA